MTKGLSVCNVDTAGGVIQPLQTAWTFNGNPVAIVGCPVAAHPPCPLFPEHCSAKMVEGQANITFNGIPVCFEGHKASCGCGATGRTEIVLEEAAI